MLRAIIITAAVLLAIASTFVAVSCCRAAGECSRREENRESEGTEK